MLNFVVIMTALKYPNQWAVNCASKKLIKGLMELMLEIFCYLFYMIIKGPSIKDVRTLEEERGQTKVDKYRQGEGGVVSQMWTSAWKKIIATIFVKYLANHARVSHLLRGQPHLLKCYYRNCLIGTHVCPSSIRMMNFSYPSV